MIKRLLQPYRENGKATAICIVVVINYFIPDFVATFVVTRVGRMIDQQNYDGLIVYLLVYLGVLLVSYVVKYIYRNLGTSVTKYERAVSIRENIYDKYFRFDTTYVEKIGTGRLIDIIGKGVQSRVDTLFTGLVTSINLLTKLGIVIYMLALIGREWVVGFIIVMILVLRYIKRYFFTGLLPIKKQIKVIGVENSRQQVRMLMNQAEIIQADMVAYETQRYIEGVYDQKEKQKIASHYTFIMFNVPVMVGYLFYGLVVLYAILTLQSGTFSIGIFAGLALVSGTLRTFLFSLTETAKNIFEKWVNIQKMFELIDNAPLSTSYDEGEDYAHTGGSIQFMGVDFAYADGTSVFKNFNTIIQGKKITALVGPSGGGKSTLLKLIAAYITPDNGYLRVGEQLLPSVSRKSYFTYVGYLTQDPNVFDGTIYENLVYAMSNQKPGDKELEEALNKAQCQFVFSLPEGIHTQIGERGIRLSGGQRQRLAIAKIFLKDPEIILLDEPTSALDSVSEQEITIALHELFKGRTVIIIAHRLQTVQYADEILVIENGTVQERGTHTQLMHAGGIYQNMVELQSGF